MLICLSFISSNQYLNSVFVSSLCLFFVKLKTAYELRISDWSSDVCSSDLPQPIGLRLGARGGALAERAHGEPAEHDHRQHDQRAERDENLHHPVRAEIGRAWCRERECEYV